MKLLERVSALLARHGIEQAVIGAAALAAHGVVRATVDLDLLAIDPACLDTTIWQPSGGSPRRFGAGSVASAAARPDDLEEAL